MITEDDIRLANCLGDGPIADAAREVVIVARELPDTRWASLARAWSVAYAFDGMERVFHTKEDPLRGLQEVLWDLAAFLRIANVTRFAAIGVARPDPEEPTDTETVEDVTGNHYGALFSSFSRVSYRDEPARLLRMRLERNNIPTRVIYGRRALDAGCGGGRYTVALRQLGASEVTGIDISNAGVTDARSRSTSGEIDGVRYERGDVLALPFAEHSFDVVFSNGVLHHTRDWKRGVRELTRVLRPGGFGWLYLIEKPGGFFWDVIEVLRVVMKLESRGTARTALRVLGLPANRIFYLLDHVMAPINVRLAPDEVETCLANAGAKGIRRLTRGADFDRVECIASADPHATAKYGVGENRYVFTV